VLQFVDSLILYPTVVRLGHVFTNPVFTVEASYGQTWERSVSTLFLHSVCFVLVIFENVFKHAADGAFGLMVFPFILVWVSLLFFCLFFFFNFRFINYWGTIRSSKVFLCIIFYLYEIQIEITKAAIELVCFAIFAWLTAILKAHIDNFMNLIELLLKSFEPILELLHVVKIYVFILEIVF